VVVLEAAGTIGGGTRTAELTLPGFRHDVCSAIHPLAAASPFFRSVKLDVEFVQPPAALAHPFDDGTAVLVRQGVDDELTRLTRPAIAVTERLLGPVSCLARSPGRAGRFGADAVRSATAVARKLKTDHARTAFLGAAAHSVLPLERKGTAGFGLMLLGLAHTHGWPFPRGGSQAIAHALADRLRARGSTIETEHRVRSLRELPPHDVVLCDVTPRQLLELGGDVLPRRYRQRLARWRYGPGVFKVDYALDAPIPWRASEVALAGTVHLGGSPAELVASERDAWEGRHNDRPFVLLAQQTLFDHTRAPAGKHTAWAYCHVPNGSTRDMRGAIENQIERFAPGFRERVLACHARATPELERENPNLVGGDISGGANLLSQLVGRRTHRTPLPWLYLCSASTPPGAGVHGMCGYLAAQAALRQTR
jgi:phytoene dehydrogenase-like protein